MRKRSNIRVFKTSYKTRDGKTKEVSHWYIELRDHLKTVRRFPAFTDRKESEALGRQVERLISCKIGGEAPGPELSRWLEQIPGRLRDQLARIGLIDPARAAAGKPLLDHVADFERNLLDRGDTAKQAGQTASRVRKILAGCRFRTWGDISPSRIQRYLAERREAGLGKATSNHYLKAAQHFCHWMVQDGRAAASPLEGLRSIEVTTDDKRRLRRPLDVAEIERLLQAASAGGRHFSMDGHERALCYKLACETGLRANEIRSLQVGCFDFNAGTVIVAGRHCKNRREAVLPLRSDTASELRALFANKLPTARAFCVPEKAGSMLRADLGRAGIPYQDGAGRYADFHALRHTCGTLLASAGVHPKTAQDLLRHSKIDLTMNVYTHTKLETRAAAVESLPALHLTGKESQRAVKTGTDNMNVTTPDDLAFCLALSGGKHRTNTDCCGKTNPVCDSKTGFSSEADGDRTHNLRIDSPML